MKRLSAAAAVIVVAAIVAACISASPSTLTPTASISPTETPAAAPERSPRFTNQNEGYTLIFTADYNVVVYERSMCLTVADVDPFMSCNGANAFVEVTEAGGQTLVQAADAVAAQANPDIEVIRSEIEIGGEPAILLDDIYSYDVLRKVVIIHADRLYVVTFVPWSEAAEEFPRVEQLYEKVVSTFEFLG
jgi:hypothetical protein